jgi:hypothetical protein
MRGNDLGTRAASSASSSRKENSMRDPSDDGDPPELRAFRDAVRDILAVEGRVEIELDGSASGQPDAPCAPQAN